MATDYATQYSSLVDERFKLASLTDAVINQDYSWDGTQTVKVYDVPTAQMNDYTRSGASRYGTPTELEPTAQAMTLSRDRSFTFTIDRGNYEDTRMVQEAGKALRRQVDEVVIPEVDTYRLAKLVSGAGVTSGVIPITKDNAYESMLDADVALTDAKAPIDGRVAFVSPAYYKYIKLDDAFIKQGDISQNLMITGLIGMVDNVRLVRVPTVYLPTGVEFVLTHRVAMTAAQKLSEYKTHDNPPGVNGWLVEGRIYYDAFTLKNKRGAIYVHKGA